MTRYLAMYFAQNDVGAFRRLLSTAFVVFLLIGAGVGLVVWALAETVFVEAFQIPDAVLRGVGFWD